MTIKWLKITLLTAAILSPGVGKIFHVTPTLPAPWPCPPPCHTLDQYAQDSILLAEDTNITLIFLIGEHNLSHDLNIECSKLFLQGQKESEQPENGVVINFNSTAKIHFEISNYLTIYNITLRSEIGTQKFEITSPTIHSVTSLLHGLTLDRMNLAVRQAFSVQISECMGSESELQFIKTMYINVERTNISGDGSRLGKKLHER